MNSTIRPPQFDCEGLFFVGGVVGRLELINELAFSVCPYIKLVKFAFGGVCVADHMSLKDWDAVPLVKH